jgi:GNAT superfamily N-acetyltransferase
MTAAPHVAPVVDPDERSRMCEGLLRSLPEWFGLEEPIRAYVRDVAGLLSFACRGEDGSTADGFLALKRHTPYAAEVYVMAVRRELHGRGCGTALLRAAEDALRHDNLELLQVKTLGPSHPSRAYARTRRFYDARGFRPLEELRSIWGDDNPCLILVKRLDAPASDVPG